MQEESQAVMSKLNEEISNLRHLLDIRENTVKARDAEIGRRLSRSCEVLVADSWVRTSRAAAEQDEEPMGGLVLSAEGADPDSG